MHRMTEGSGGLGHGHGNHCAHLTAWTSLGYLPGVATQNIFVEFN